MDRTGIGLVLLCFCVGVPRALGQNYVNVATGKTYKQKSTYSNQGPSSNAANGDTRGTYGDSNCIYTQVYGTSSYKSYDTNPWWQVDLGRTYPVYSIKVWARSGFNYRLYPFTVTVDGQQCAKVTYRYSRSVSVTCSSGVMYGRVVRLTRTGRDQPLNLCEFQIFECQAGWYGDTCNTACLSNNCLNNECNQQTGLCTACAGNFTGDYCTECKAGFYGTNCDLACDQQCQGECYKTTGYCISCPSGYYGSWHCYQPCSTRCASSTCERGTGKCYGCQAGWYGDKCNAACRARNCLNNECNQQTGLCTACAGNFAGDYCTECQDGYYKQGAQCLQCSNNCAPNTICNKDTGKCYGCIYGYYGDRCKQACSGLNQGCAQCSQDGQTCTQCLNGFAAPSCSGCRDGYYKQGAQCVRCSSNCAPNTNCSKLTGKCDGCVDGYHGDMCNLYCTTSGRCLRCDQETGVCLACSPSSSNLAPPSCTECLDGFYDPYSYPTSCTNCTWRCYNDTACDKRTGNCDRCPPGKSGDRCGQLCSSGSYGQDCSESCGHCQNNSACDVVSGACNGCEAGFQPPLCKTGCENGTYGVDCGQTCGHCKDGTACDKVDGQCALCDPGWLQPMCKTQCPHGYYGDGCNKTCGNCLEKSMCRHDTGQCHGGCAQGFTGSLCVQAKSEKCDGGLQSLVGPVVGSIFGVGLLLTISLTAAICWRRRSQENLVRTNNPPIALSDKKICTPDPPTNASTAPVPANSANESMYVEVGDTENTYDKLHPYSNEDAERQQYSQFAPSGRDVDTPTADSAYLNTSLPMGKEDGKI